MESRVQVTRRKVDGETGIPLAMPQQSDVEPWDSRPKKEVMTLRRPSRCPVKLTLNFTLTPTPPRSPESLRARSTSH